MKLTVNSRGGSWRAVGNYLKKVAFWYGDQPEFAAAEGRRAESVLAKVEVRETAAVASRYREFYFAGGDLVFFFRSEKMGDDAAGDERIYFKDGKPLLRLLRGGKSCRKPRLQRRVFREAAYWQKAVSADLWPRRSGSRNSCRRLGQASCRRLAGGMHGEGPSTQVMNRCLGQAYEKWTPS